MELLQSLTPQPQGHDYIQTSAAPTTSTATQTLLTSDDIKRLEDQAAVPPPATPVDDFVSSAILGSDERVNFYTGIPSTSMLNGKYMFSNF